MAEATNLALTAIDRKILGALQENGRMTIQAIIDLVGLSVSSCLRWIRQMEQIGIITGYSASVDQKAAGLPVSVFISIKLERQLAQELDAFGAAIGRWPEVMECYLMTGAVRFSAARGLRGPGSL